MLVGLGVGSTVAVGTGVLVGLGVGSTVAVGTGVLVGCTGVGCAGAVGTGVLVGLGVSNTTDIEIGKSCERSNVSPTVAVNPLHCTVPTFILGLTPSYVVVPLSGVVARCSEPLYDCPYHDPDPPILGSEVRIWLYCVGLPTGDPGL